MVGCCFNNEEDVTQLYSEVVRSCKYDQDPSRTNQENKDLQRNHMARARIIIKESTY